VSLRPGTPWFTYLLQENAQQERSIWLWIKILLNHAYHLVGALVALEKALGPFTPHVVITNTATITLGALYAVIHRRPHLWFVKECLDTSKAAPRALARWIERVSTMVVVPSHATAQAFEKRIKVIPDGSDVARIRASAANGSPRHHLLSGLGLPPEHPVVAQIGGLVWWKGQHLTVAALGHIAQERGFAGFSLLFLGGGIGSPYNQDLERQLERTVPGWRERIRFVQFDPDDFSYVAAADLVVHPSVLPDPFPNAVREAMLLGKPVIGARSGGIPEMIKHGETGILVRPDDPVELGMAMLDLLQSPSQRDALGRRAQAHALSHFDIQARKSEFLELFQGTVR
jgi:glycosyltransferase involved in cell wall biosynthesis